MNSWVRYSVAVYLGLLMAGSLVPPKVNPAQWTPDEAATMARRESRSLPEMSATGLIVQPRRDQEPTDRTES